MSTGCGGRVRLLRMRIMRVHAYAWTTTRGEALAQDGVRLHDVDVPRYSPMKGVLLGRGFVGFTTAPRPPVVMTHRNQGAHGEHMGSEAPPRLCAHQVPRVCVFVLVHHGRRCRRRSFALQALGVLLGYTSPQATCTRLYRHECVTLCHAPTGPPTDLPTRPGAFPMGPRG
jgi:hypothetical protein